MSTERWNQVAEAGDPADSARVLTPISFAYGKKCVCVCHAQSQHHVPCDDSVCCQSALATWWENSRGNFGYAAGAVSTRVMDTVDSFTENPGYL
jgi:hypothetical protein